jgi:hypothetical protein
MHTVSPHGSNVLYILASLSSVLHNYSIFFKYLHSKCSPLSPFSRYNYDVCGLAEAPEQFRKKYVHDISYVCRIVFRHTKIIHSISTCEMAQDLNDDALQRIEEQSQTDLFISRERAVREGDRLRLQRLPQDRLIDIIFQQREGVNPASGRRQRSEDVRRMQRSETYEPITQQVVDRLRAQVEVLEFRVESERVARDRMERANQLWEQIPAYYDYSLQEVPEPNLERLTHLGVSDFACLGREGQYERYVDALAVARVMWVHNQELRARIEGGYGTPWDPINHARSRFMRRLDETLAPARMFCREYAYPHERGYVSDRVELIEEMLRLRRLLGEVLGECAVRIPHDDPMRPFIGRGAIHRAEEIVTAQGHRISQLLQSNLQAYVSMAFLENVVRHLRRQLRDAVDAALRRRNVRRRVNSANSNVGL